MSGQNKITVILDALDKLSPVLRGLGSQTQGLGAGAVFLGNMYTSALSQAAGAVGALTNRFSDAAGAQESAIKLAGQFGAMTNKDYAYGAKLVGDLNEEIGEMAATLGDAAGFKDLGLAISDTLIKSNSLNDIFDEKAFKQQALSLTKTLGLLKDPASGIENSDIQLFFTKFAEGASESELSVLKLNERMPGLMGQLEKASKKIHGEGKKIEDLTLQQRVKIFEAATQGLAPPEMIRDLQTTAKTRIKAIEYSLFDESAGLFGFLRAVTKVNDKSRNVMDGFATLLASVLGKGGLFDTVGKTLKALGLNLGDPMLLLYNGVMTVSGWAQKAGDFLRGLTLPDLTKLSPERLGQVLADTIDAAFGKLGDLSKINFGQLAKSLGDAVTFSLKALGSFLANLDWTTYLSVGLVVIGGTLAIGVIGALGAAIAAGVAAITSVPVLVAAGVALLAIGAVKVVTDNWGLITAIWGNTWTWIKDSAVNAFNSVKDWIGGVINKVITSIGSTFTSFIGSVQNSVQRIVESVQTWFQDSVERIKGFLANPIGTVKGMVTGQAVSNNTAGLNAGQAVSNNAAGLNVGSLFSAIARETALMPSGSNLAIANTSETILNRAQQRDLVSLVSATRTRGGGSTFAPQIVVNPAPGMNEESLANLVMNRMEQHWNQYQLSSL
ncbi:MAG: hypothetical protein KME10_17945 [Plectolyngbya sp. WJT66-NPBG17]|jgi:hypothetical protein|nr:hypothetical protein [Plectolyngbya sp. WJT66-NPBG17]